MSNVRRFTRFSKLSWSSLVACCIAVVAGQAVAQVQLQRELPDEQPVKVRVSDPSVAAQIARGGGRLLTDYGNFQIFEVRGELARSRSTGTGDVELRSHYHYVALNAGAINTRSPEAQSQRRITGSFAGKRLHLVQFVGPILPAWRHELDEMGLQTVCYIPHNAYLVYGDEGAIARMQSWAQTAPYVEWEGEYLDRYKVHPGLGADAKTPRGTAAWVALQMVSDPDANRGTLELIEQMRTEPVRRQSEDAEYRNVIVRLPLDRIVEVAARPEVISIQPYAEPRKNDERQNQIIAGNLTGTSPSGPGYLAWLSGKGFSQAQFTASGFAVDVSDSGVDNGTTAPGHFGLYRSGNSSLASRIVYNRLEGSPNNPGSTLQGCDGHGTINAHIIGGYNDQPAGFPHTDAAGYHYGLGVCPFVKIGSSVIFDPSRFTFPNYNNLQSKAYQDGARISANSWGANVAGAYNSDSQSYDRLVRDAQPSGATFASPGNQEMVIVFAAGNAGPGGQTVGSPGTAKNVITVGAAENVHSHSTANGGNNAAGNDGCNTPDSEADSADDMAVFSSRGPCSDGRKKPELVAPGTHVTGGVAQTSPPPSPSGNGSALSCFDGTGVCGLPGGGTPGDPDNFFPLGQQFFTTSSGTSHSTPAVAGACALLRQHFINNGWSPPSPALTKAFLMNSARYMTGSGANDSLWSNSQGMGELNLGFALDGQPRIVRDQLLADKFTSSGQTRTYTGTIADPGKPFRVTLAWTDAPGNTAGSAYNNDLDLTVTIGGVTYKGNVLSGAVSQPGGNADFQNNVESVFLPAGVDGSFAVTITAANINSDGVPNEAPSLDQDFALVVYNAVEMPVPVLSIASATVVAENCHPANGAVDPGETVTIHLALRNHGTLDATNVIATLLATNGITAPSGPVIYGYLPAGGSSVTQSFSFTASGVCGETIHANLRLQDGEADLGTIATSLLLGSAVQAGSSYTNGASISIPATGNSGKASPFPSTLSVSGITGPVSKVTVTLRGLSHTFPDDIDVLLVGPTGHKILLMSDVGGSHDINGVTLTFDDAAAIYLPDEGQIVSGTYKPSNVGSGDTFSSPAPAGPYGSTLSVLNGLNLNGTWSLYIEDDATRDTGNLAQGWSISITTSNLTCCEGNPPLPSADLHVTKSASSGLVNVGQVVTFAVSVTNSGPDPATGVTITDSLPAGLNFISATATLGAVTNTGGVVTCEINTLPMDAHAVLTIEAGAGTPGYHTNTATASSSTADPTMSNNSASAPLFVNSIPVLSVIEDQFTNEDVPLGPVPFTVEDAETPSDELILLVESSNTNLVPHTNIQLSGLDTNRTVTIVPATNAFGEATITLHASDGHAIATTFFTVTVAGVNDPPALAPIPDHYLFEGASLVFTNIVTDVDSGPEGFLFQIVVGPINASVGTNDGIFLWTPGEEDGPGTNLITIMVSDGGIPSLSSTQSFTVTVLETNSPPVLAPIANRVIHAGAGMAVTTSASDDDIPANLLTFSLESAPPGASLNPTNGLLTWVTEAQDANTTNHITVRVTDDGIPPLNDVASFTVTVLPPPFIQAIDTTNDTVTITWTAIEGQTYRLQFTEDLAAGLWSDLSPVVASGATATAEDVLGTNDRFYRVIVVP